MDWASTADCIMLIYSLIYILIVLAVFTCLLQPTILMVIDIINKFKGEKE
jgi:hypothetical protein